MIASKFYIQSKIGLGDWVLTAGSDGRSVHLTHKSVNDPNQLWQKEDDSRGGFFLYNFGTRKVLHRTTSQGGQVELVSQDYSDPSLLWRQENFGSWLGINTLVDWEQKLNVSGGEPYDERTPIILWEYTNGADNESWQFAPAPEPKPVDPKQGFYIQSKIGLGDWVLTAGSDGRSVHLTHKSVNDPNQLWQKEDDSRGGFFLYNFGTRKVLHRTTSQGGQVELVSQDYSDPSLLWRQENFGSWLGINTLVDWEQKLNVSGGEPYDERTPIILWEYTNGADNESWQFAPAPEPKPVDPKQGFYIQSKIGLGDWVLTAGSDGRSVHLTHKSVNDPNQLWQKEDDSRGGFFLYNFGTRKVLHRTTSQGGQVELVSQDYSDPSLLWRQENFGSWLGINTLVDWEQKLNVSGGEPYDERTPIILWEYTNGADNESWRFAPAMAISLDQVEQLIRTYGPIVKLHPDEKYFMDDPDTVLASGKTQLQWGLVHNEEDYDNFKQDDVYSSPVSSASNLLSTVTVAKQDSRSANLDFRYWLHIDDSQKPGNQSRAKALVSVQETEPAFVNLQFWFFYPFNGPGKFRLTVGDVMTEHIQIDTCGRHYADWEHVTLRFRWQPGSNPWYLVDVYLSRHDISTWIGDLSALQFRGQHPVIYAARDSHAHYSSAGSQYYKRVWSQGFFVGTAAVDLEDLTADGQEFDTSNLGNYAIVASSVPEHNVQKPDWWSFEGRWGQYERLRHDQEIRDKVVGHLYTYPYEEVGAGPKGPVTKPYGL